MSVIAQDVFMVAMQLMDETTDEDTFESYPDSYKKKAWRILTMLQAELLGPKYSPVGITSEQDPFQIDDKTAITVLPYGLAAHLLISDPSQQAIASFFNDRYDELKRKRPAKISSIKDVYGIKEWTEEEIKDPTVSDVLGGTFGAPSAGKVNGGEF